MDPLKIQVIAMDLDGTLTQHRSPLEERTRQTLVALSRRYRLLMVGAGRVERIYTQMGRFPLDIVGNYGLQYGEYQKETGEWLLLRDEHIPVKDRESVDRRMTEFRRKHGLEAFAGESVEYHPSGCITLPLLGTAAVTEDKLRFDPDRSKRRALLEEVKALFPEYTVFVGGSSSFDMAPAPYDKYYALDLFCKEKGLLHENVLYVGDDYGLGGNDESVYQSDFAFLKIDDYRSFPDAVAPLLEEK